MAFRELAAHVYESSCPQLSRHLLSNMSRREAAKQTDVEEQSCIHCHSFLRPDSSRVKLRPRAGITKEIERLKRRWESPRGRLLSPAQRKKLRRWMNSKNVIVIRCSTCHKPNRFPGASRTDRPVLSCKPDSSSQSKTPVASPPAKKRRRDFTPGRQPTSVAISTPRAQTKSMPGVTAGRRSRSAKKDRHRQLEMMLQSARREQQASAESPLSKFLTSL
ncbi:UPF0711 protein C18orf21-like [Diadema setosum]|uniref:UPF0711 protein C18orf21-like n=1 Tax=Diadema setosum TaxID=31175 RepID=UPI003B3BA75E